MKELELLLKTVGSGLKVLAQGVNTIADKLDDFVETNRGGAAEPQAKTRAETSGRRTSRRTSERPDPEGKKDQSAIDIVYGVISRARGPVKIDLLAEKTGLEKKKLHNILYRLKKQGRIENVSKGVYKKV